IGIIGNYYLCLQIPHPKKNMSSSKFKRTVQDNIGLEWYGYEGYPIRRTSKLQRKYFPTYRFKKPSSA
ncbi:hypothetical protein CEXT_499951, partial [Caerostris extrusa]